jgi:hypothetical protein
VVQKQRRIERSGARAANHLPPWWNATRCAAATFFFYKAGEGFVRPRSALLPRRHHSPPPARLRLRRFRPPERQNPQSNPSAPAHARSARPFPSPTHGDALRPPPRRIPRRRLLQGMAAPASVLFPLLASPESFEISLAI